MRYAVTPLRRYAVTPLRRDAVTPLRHCRDTGQLAGRRIDCTPCPGLLN